MASVAGWELPARYGSAAEVAAYAGLSSKTIRRMVSSGKVRGSKVGRRVLIPFEDLDGLVRKSAVSPAVAPPSSALDASGRARPLGPGEAAWRARRAIEALDSLDGLGDDAEQAGTLSGLLDGLAGGPAS